MWQGLLLKAITADARTPFPCGGKRPPLCTSPAFYLAGFPPPGA